MTPGLQLAFEDGVFVDVAGRTLAGEPVTRNIPVCGPAAYTVLKAFAFANRGERKDAFDLSYVISHTAGGGGAVAERLFALSDRGIVVDAISLLVRDFESADMLGPQRAGKFMLADGATQEEVDQTAADLHGPVADVLARWAELVG